MIEQTNEQRAERAYRAALAYTDDSSDIESAIVDLMADLLHLSEQSYGGAEDAHRVAWHHFVAERNEGTFLLNRRERS